MRFARVAFIALLATAVAGIPARAQSAIAASSSAAVPSSAPTVGAATVGAHRLDRNAPTDPSPSRGDTKQNRALMIVGGVALVVGLVISGGAGTLIAIGGAVVGLVGLWQYLQ